MGKAMGSRLFAISFNATRPLDLAQFWSGVLRWPLVDIPDHGAELASPDPVGFRIRFLPSQAPKIGHNRAHFDLTSTSTSDQQETVARALALGGKHADVGQRPDEPHVVLADPDGNEFCVIQPGNEFLAGTGFMGALACNGSQEVGYFWSEVLQWPLVWDQDEETAIQSPNGGTKITWSGPPVAPKTGANRLYLELVVAEGASWKAEIDRLKTLGATPAGVGDKNGGSLLMLDLDGNEFVVHQASARRNGC
jgi:hypothetical protein